MKLLAVDTATEACSAALYLEGEIVERYRLAPREHARLILPMIDELMTEAGLSLSNLDALAFGAGPGSFTGLRIAAGVIHGLALGADLPVVPVSTLAAVAQEFFDRTKPKFDSVFVAMDARMGEIYYGIYRFTSDGVVERVGDEKVIAPESVPRAGGRGVGIGTGWRTYGAILQGRMQGMLDCIETENLPRARAIARLGAWGAAAGLAVDVEDAQPVYLRNKVAKKEFER